MDNHGLSVSGHNIPGKPLLVSDIEQGRDIEAQRRYYHLSGRQGRPGGTVE
jgi:hypothetical protein